jgi:hypothetical protein
MGCSSSGRYGQNNAVAQNGETERNNNDVRQTPVFISFELNLSIRYSLYASRSPTLAPSHGGGGGSLLWSRISDWETRANAVAKPRLQEAIRADPAKS